MIDDAVGSQGNRYLRVWARAGYAARGLVYLIIGAMALLAAFGEGGGTTDSRGALQQLLTAPFGGILLLLVALGLVGYAVWRVIQAVKDPDRHGSGPRGLAIRVALAFSAVLHLLLAAFAASLVVTFSGLSSASGGGSEGAQGFVGWLMSQPYGAVMVMVLGVIVAVAGVAHGIKGWKATFSRYLETPPGARSWIYPICRFGLVIRGVVLIIIGALFFAAGYYYEPSAAGGTQEMFTTVRNQPYGAALFLVIALGLLAFGVYGLLESAFRRVDA